LPYKQNRTSNSPKSDIDEWVPPARVDFFCAILIKLIVIGIRIAIAVPGVRHDALRVIEKKNGLVDGIAMLKA
jgi:hypothetical protein